MPKEKTFRIPIIPVHQNIGDFFVGVISAHDLFRIVKTDILRLIDLEVPKYTGYQRAIVPGRVNSIEDYLTTDRSTFPNSIIINLDSDQILNWNGGLLENEIILDQEDTIAKVIDGQHRAAALKHASPHFQVIVTIFVDLSIEFSAEIFAKINSTQKSVNPSIAYQLFGYSEERSPQKTAHDIATLLNITDGSPFYRKLLMLGTKDEWAKGTLSQATFAKFLMRLYTRNPEEDQNRILRKEELEQYSGYPLRDHFIDGNDSAILEIIWEYFDHVQSTWPKQWWDSKNNSILPKTTGYSAFLEVLRVWMLNLESPRDIELELLDNPFEELKDKYETNQHMFIRDNYPSGNAGIIKLRKSLLEDLGVKPKRASRKI